MLPANDTLAEIRVAVLELAAALALEDERAQADALDTLGRLLDLRTEEIETVAHALARRTAARGKD